MLDVLVAKGERQQYLNVAFLRLDIYFDYTVK